MRPTTPDRSPHPSPSLKQGRLFIISAPSGAGKTTLCRAMLKRFPGLVYSISHTTRPPRKNEKNGVDYFFITQEEFEKNIRDGKWLEWARVHGHYYGTSLEFIENNLSQGRNILLDIDVAGARQILSRIPQSIAVFILPPSFEALQQRLESRGTDSRETIARRLQGAEKEMAQKQMYPYHVINDSLDDAIENLSAIIESHCALKRNDDERTRK